MKSHTTCRSGTLQTPGLQSPLDPQKFWSVLIFVQSVQVPKSFLTLTKELLAPFSALFSVSADGLPVQTLRTFRSQVSPSSATSWVPKASFCSHPHRFLRSVFWSQRMADSFLKSRTTSTRTLTYVTAPRTLRTLWHLAPKSLPHFPASPGLPSPRLLEKQAGHSLFSHHQVSLFYENSNVQGSGLHP